MPSDLKYFCLKKMCQMIEKSNPVNCDDCDAIIEFIGEIPKEIMLEWEETFFDQHFKIQDSTSELQYLLWYKLFLKKSCSRFWLNIVQDCTKNSSTPLMYAIEKKHERVVQIILETLEDEESFVDLNLVINNNAGSDIRHAFNEALKARNFVILEMLLKTVEYQDRRKRIDVNKTPKHGHPVAQLFKFGDPEVNLEMAKAILSKEDFDGNKIVDLEMGEEDKSDILRQIFMTEKAETVQFILSFMNLDSIPYGPSFFVVYNSNYGAEIFSILLEMPNFYIGVYKDMLLKLACLKENVKLFKILLSTLDNKDENRRININAKCPNDNTVLHMISDCAYLKKSLSLAQLILETLKHEDPKCRIQLYVRNKDNETALDIAQRKRHISEDPYSSDLAKTGRS